MCSLLARACLATTLLKSTALNCLGTSSIWANTASNTELTSSQSWTFNIKKPSLSSSIGSNNRQSLAIISSNNPQSITITENLSHFSWLLEPITKSVAISEPIFLKLQPKCTSVAISFETLTQSIFLFHFFCTYCDNTSDLSLSLDW